MTALAAGNNVEVYVPLEGSMTITPGSGGSVEFGCSSPSTEPPYGRRLYATAAITIPAGSTVFLRAVDADATYAAPEVGTGAGTVSSYTAAQLDAMEAGGTLTPDTWYAASDSAIFGLATSASTLARVDFDALALAMAQGIVTDDSETINNKAGIPTTMAALVALAETNAYPRTFVLAQSDGQTPPLVFAATTFIAAFTLSNPASTTMRIIGAGVHGLGASSEGKYIWVQTSAGVPSGFYEITDRGTATDRIEVDVGAYSSLIGSTTLDYVARTNQVAQAVVSEIPGGAMGPNGVLEVEFWLRSSTSTANAKNYIVAYGTDADGDGGTECAATSFSSAYAVRPTKPSALLNMGAVNSQLLFSFSTTHTVTPPSAAIDTDQNFYVAIRLRNGVVDEDVEILAWRITLTPGV